MLTSIFFSSKRKIPSEKYFDRLIRPHIPKLYATAYRLTGVSHDAEDIVQDVLIKLYPKTHELSKIEDMEPWLLRVLYNTFVDHSRKTRRREISNYESIESLSDVEQSQSDILDNEPGTLLGHANVSKQIYRALNSLSCEKRSLVVLHIYESYTLHQLAIVFDLPVGTVKSRLHRAKEEIKTKLRMEPFYVADRDKDTRIKK